MSPDIVIVGAGAAGIGAGLELQARGIPFVILEAADRAGGRAYTDVVSMPVPWDQGCHWLHCADSNPLVEWADRLGAVYAKTKPENFLARWAAGSWQDEAQNTLSLASLEQSFEAIYRAAERGEDVPLADVLPDAGEWHLTNRYFLQLMACEDLDRVSALAYGDYEDTGFDWPVLSGYGALVAKMAEGLPISLGKAVSRVDQREKCVRVTTATGEIEAKGVILTASTNVLLSDAIEISEGPARDLLNLIQHVPCGTYEKVAIALRRLPPEFHGRSIVSVDPRDGTMPQDFQVSNKEPPLLLAHMAGSLPRELGKEGPEDMIAYAVYRLALAFGSDIRKEIVKTGATNWQHNPLTLGSYSYTRPGHADARREMIAADTGRVAFAGEAFSLKWQATAHGAYQSGRDAASRLAESL